ncbi:MAG: ATP-binding cassette domain-containing protein [Candidatus Thiodiazotropha taylori]|uniref:ATP-binding cassette domain-containing protein n=1 Tax=Candidatus Thiodiazotropha taylori TaxID=2792791 RepID=A0A9E4N7M3_9GAMM|nr:ATP-binding cassette domain-containing protein [Candidatus Thiodiazotropha taylori]MCG8057676.1 ATP-binding cassette domain-containing protein [Candidatus Thiodiazotropha taylori]MCW4259116.1 ATP-binding cassette domain-containing protein [Candidatus Thiodiazotropha taylori]MCW4319509.1 ATP-binding cassette domain-containing protein [Candidatus Thiodiazotropha taylori]
MSGAKQKPILSEILADALRHNRLDDIHLDSPFAASLMPLLKALGWHHYARELIEALPHFTDTIDLVDLRNILVNLGYESSVEKINLRDIREELYPCLFLGRKGEILVLEERQNETISFYDANSGEHKTLPVKSLKGTAYYFTDTHTTHGFVETESRQAWFARLMRRFQGLTWHLLSMSFLINLVALAVPLFIMLVYDKVIGAKSVDALPWMVAGIGSALLADMALRYLRARVIGNIAGRLDYLIGVETFKQILHLPPLFTERSTMAAQLSRLKQFDSVRDFFTGPNATLILELPFVLMFVIVIGFIAGPVALVPVVMLMIYAAFGALWLPASAHRVTHASASRTDKQRMQIQTLNGRYEIKGVGGETTWWERYREFSGEAVTANYRTTVSNAVITSFAQGAMSLSGVAVLAIGTYMVIAGSMSIGALIATMALIWRVLAPLQSAFLSFSRFEQVSKTIQQINQLMKLDVERHSGRSALMLTELKGRINIDRVSFRYGPNYDPALLGISIHVEPGEMLAIMGETGSGKSTLTKLIAGMYRPQAGSLSIDEFDIRQLNAMDLRRAIAYVPQNPHFFHGTVAQNLRLNNVLATDDELRQACSQAGILEEIERLPKGFDTRIGDNTTEHLPPGLTRGLSMARAFLRPAPIILLDEPGASLDIESDERFMQQIKKLKGTKTIIMVTHRPSHVRLADKVIVLDQGSEVFAGDPDKAIQLVLESVA